MSLQVMRARIAHRPVVSIYKNDVLKAIVQVKIYLSETRIALKEIQTLRNIKEKHQKMKAIIVIFDEEPWPKNGKVYFELKK